MALLPELYSRLFLYAPDAPTYVALMQVSSQFHDLGEKLKHIKLVDYTMRMIKESRGRLYRKHIYSVLPNSMHHGPYIHYYETRPHRESKYFYEEGQCYLGKKEGEYVLWYGHLVDNKIKKLNMAEKGFYHEGKLEGERRHWYESGNSASITYMKDNNLHGLHRTWNEDGQPHEECTYKEGTLHGERKTWYLDGKLCTSGMYENGIPVGVHTEYDYATDCIIYFTFNEKGEKISEVRHNINFY